MRIVPWLIAVAAVTALIAGTPLAAQTPEDTDPTTMRPLPRTGDTVEWYTVQNGDTLEGLTRRYLGTHTLWRENHRLNPQLRDPNVLTPGQRIRLITDRSTEDREAEVTLVSRRVQSYISTGQIKPTRVGDRLREKDGVETKAASSAELALDPTSNLYIGENSLVFLQRVASSLVGVRREEIDIQQGQAELAAQIDRPEFREIEIIIGGTRAAPAPDEEGTTRTRARKANDGGAAVMVYGGSSQVEAAGAAVAVAEGMGTTVPEDGPPNPPEPLLPAPALTAPAADVHFSYSNPPFHWSPVEGAASYIVEVCGDPQCSGLVARATDVHEARWPAEPLPVGALYWRVTAVSPSGLDGYPSAAWPFAIDSDRQDLLPPVVAAIREGPGSTTDDAATLGANSALRLDGHDDASGVAEIQYRWDGGDWQRWTGDAIAPGSAEATLEVRATDNLGRQSAVWSLPVRVGVL